MIINGLTIPHTEMKEFLLRNKACSKTQSKPLMSHSSSLNTAPGYEVGDRMICFLVLCLTTLFQSNGWMKMNGELERMWKETIVALFLRYYPSICLKGLRNATNNFTQDNLSPGRPECEAGVLTTRPRRSVRRPGFDSYLGR
jgi:hypothetical protein